MKKLIIIATSIAATVAAHATQVTVSAGIGATGSRFIQTSNTLNLAPAGSLVLLGKFSNPSGITGATDFASMALAGGWQEFNNPAVGTATLALNASSKVAGIEADNSAAANAFNGQRIYMWIFNATSTAAATEMGIFSGPVGAWTFPTNAGGVGDTTTIGTQTNAAFIALGGVGTLTNNGSYLRLVSAIPEPTTISLGALAGLIALGSRRRARKQD